MTEQRTLFCSWIELHKYINFDVTMRAYIHAHSQTQRIVYFMQKTANKKITQIHTLQSIEHITSIIKSITSGANGGNRQTHKFTNAANYLSVAMYKKMHYRHYDCRCMLAIAQRCCCCCCYCPPTSPIQWMQFNSIFNFRQWVYRKRFLV